MTTHERDRRSVLLSTVAWAAGITAIALTRQAKAFQIEDVSPSSLDGLAISQRCGPASEHTALIAKLQTMLNQDSSRDSITAICPICGCPVVVTR
jgi:hypothetical protein